MYTTAALGVLVVSIIYSWAQLYKPNEKFVALEGKGKSKRRSLNPLTRPRDQKVPCKVPEKERLNKNPEGAKKGCTGNISDRKNKRGVNKVSSLEATTHLRQLRPPDRIPSNRKSMGVSFNPDKPLEERDFLNANLGHIVMPEQLPKRLGIADIRGTPYIKLGSSSFAGGGGLEPYLAPQDDRYLGLTRM